MGALSRALPDALQGGPSRFAPADVDAAVSATLGAVVGVVGHLGAPRRRAGEAETTAR